MARARPSWSCRYRRPHESPHCAAGQRSRCLAAPRIPYAGGVQSHQLTLYVDGYFTSTWDATCFVALTEKQVEFTTARALLRDGGVPAALRKATAIARVPALQHGEFWLTESLAIVEYLEEAFPPPDWAPLFPVDVQARARARQIMAYMRFELRALRAERPWQYSVYPL